MHIKIKWFCLVIQFSDQVLSNTYGICEKEICSKLAKTVSITQIVNWALAWLLQKLTKSKKKKNVVGIGFKWCKMRTVLSFNRFESSKWQKYDCGGWTTMIKKQGFVKESSCKFFFLLFSKWRKWEGPSGCDFFVYGYNKTACPPCFLLKDLILESRVPKKKSTSGQGPNAIILNQDRQNVNR